jgi:hypothetical protein
VLKKCVEGGPRVCDLGAMAEQHAYSAKVLKPPDRGLGGFEVCCEGSGRAQQFAGDHAEAVADEENSSVLVDEAQVARRVTRGGDDAEGSDGVSFSQRFGAR